VRRRIGLGLLGLGVALIAWVGVTLVWGDPFTSLYTRHEQHVLGQQLDRIQKSWHHAAPKTASRRKASAAHTRPAAAARLVADARLFRRELHDGSPIGRIRIPRLHLEMVVVQGTSESDLAKGPGHYDAGSGANTSLPGLGGVIGIAGHRTTYLHPFRHIDDLRPGDNVYLQMPYGTFRYRVYYHKVVPSDDWSILRPRPYEKLVLTACHPLYSASHRWAVFARLQGHSEKVA
jgi:sortase A